MLKRSLILSCAIILSFNLSFAQDKMNDEDFIKVQLLIKEGFPKNFNQVKWYSDKLSSEKKLYLYDDNSKSGILPFFLNLFPGFGLGSWSQGDITGGLIGTIGMGSGLALVLSFWEMGGGEVGATSLGALLFYSSYFTGLILPWTYASGYNSKLKDALQMSELSDIMIVPSVNISKNNLIYPTANLRIQF